MEEPRKSHVRKGIRAMPATLTTHSPLKYSHEPGAAEHNAKIKELQMAADPEFFEMENRRVLGSN